MAEYRVRTKWNSAPDGKPRIYFTSHPDDFDRYFDKLCEDIFKTCDCAIYYTEDMTAPLDAEMLDVDLGRMNLFIVPVTLKLLTKPCRAMSVDIAYAKRENVAILPFMMESGIDTLYSLPAAFGERQYLFPYPTDGTEIGYEKKLERYLEAVFVGEDITNAVRDSFRTYVFLSYRKKDRRHANELMRLIHADPDLLDVAIWYDEFLTPGDNFKNNIDSALGASKLFMLLVTPSVLEEPDGGPNFVMGVEYPMARDLGMKILPLEAVSTDRARLADKFEMLPECIDAKDITAIKNSILSALGDRGSAEKEDPRHKFLMGTAYLEGIDVEVDVSRGLELLIAAADAGYAPASFRLSSMYSSGNRVPLNYSESARWGERFIDAISNTYGEENFLYVGSVFVLAEKYEALGNYKRANELASWVYSFFCKMHGEDNSDTLESLKLVASTYSRLGEMQKAAEMFERLYQLKSKLTGEESVDSMFALAASYYHLGEYRKVKSLWERAYELLLKKYGDCGKQTLSVMLNLAVVYGKLGDYKAELELEERALAAYLEYYGEEDPRTLTAINNIGPTCSMLGDYERAKEMGEWAYRLRCKVLGEEHPDTAGTLMNLALTYTYLGDGQGALSAASKCFDIYRRVLGEDHPKALDAEHVLADKHYRLSEYGKARALLEDAYERRVRTCGENHPESLRIARSIKTVSERIAERDGATVGWPFAMSIFRDELLAALDSEGICTAENLLFSRIDEYPELDFSNVAKEFYEILSKMSDAELAANDFSREEIAEGYADVLKKYGS